MEIEVANEQERRQRAASWSFDEEGEKLRGRLRSIIDLGKTQRALAREAGVSESALSQWMRRRFEGDAAALVQKLEQWEVNQEAAADTKLPLVGTWVETETGLNIARALEFAQVAPSISLIYGAAGVGKSTAVARYSMQRPNVWCLTSSPAANGVIATLTDVAGALGMRGLPQHAFQIAREIVQRARGTGGLLVVDEAQHLSQPALEQLRNIHDVAGIGLALSGNETVYTRIAGGRGRAVFAQFTSRLGCRLRLSAPATEDVDAILASWQIEGQPEVQFGRTIAMSPGGLRGLFQMLRQASIAARAADKPVNLRLMRSAWRELGGEL